jgi:hypothetical protein
MLKLPQTCMVRLLIYTELSINRQGPRTAAASPQRPPAPALLATATAKPAEQTAGHTQAAVAPNVTATSLLRLAAASSCWSLRKPGPAAAAAAATAASQAAPPQATQAHPHRLAHALRPCSAAEPASTAAASTTPCAEATASATPTRARRNASRRRWRRLAAA